jgi:hypothetical protein
MFLKGPIPWTWIIQAAQLPGKALHVATVTWFLAGMKNSAVIRLSVSKLHMLGVRRHSAYRALKALEGAQLISVERHTGRSPIVTILASNPPTGEKTKDEEGANLVDDTSENSTG